MLTRKEPIKTELFKVKFAEIGNFYKTMGTQSTNNFLDN